ncbi:MAG: DUF362 domain-containing protein [Acidobacteria bacterium]|nr:DUF362 domain-containing protein [Acidobacteriota bacterium]
MSFRRRDFVSTLLTAAAAAQVASRGARAASKPLGIPGLFPGRVVSARHTGSVVDGKFQAEPIRAMMRKGMTELTGAPDWIAAWRMFFEPGDVVGIKVNPVGQPDVVSSPEVLHEIIAGLRQAGVKAKDIVVYDRYRRQFLHVGFDKWLPEGVRWSWAAEDYQENQLGMDGYDENHYMEMALAYPGEDARDPHVRRSYAAQFITQQVNKLVNLPVLKHHQSAGVTLALKNLSHGLVNNVSRSHSSSTLNACGAFIPAVVSVPVIRDKTVLHILDGTLGMWHGGPGGRHGKYVWAHHTIYFATDPVAVDKTGWQVIDAQRAAKGMASVALSKPDADSGFLNCQPEHIEIAGALGLGVFDDQKIVRKQLDLG